MNSDNNKSLTTIILVLVVSIAGAAYYFLKHNHLNGSAALYMGIPILLAIALSFTDKASTIVGGTMKAITIILLLLAPLIGEGYICIIMAAPIFYLIAYVAALLVQYITEKKDKSLKSHMLLGILMLGSIEGTTPELSFNRDHQVSATQILAIPASTIKIRLAQQNTFDSSRPLLLRIFPLPHQIENEGIELGDKIKLDFTYSKLFFLNTTTGQMQWQISKANDNNVHYTLLSDNSYMSNYMRWQSSHVEWRAIDENQTEIT